MHVKLRPEGYKKGKYRNVLLTLMNWSVSMCGNLTRPAVTVAFTVVNLNLVFFSSLFSQAVQLFVLYDLLYISYFPTLPDRTSPSGSNQRNPKSRLCNEPKTKGNKTFIFIF